MNKKELSAYMSALGKAGGKRLAEIKKKEDPGYYSRIRKEAWAKKRKREREEAKEAGDKSE